MFKNKTKIQFPISGTVEKLLTLLESNDDEDEVLSCSEDEGVEADLSESEECLEETGNLKVLYQLALLLTEELKCPRTEDYPVVSDSSSLLDRINDDPMDRLSSQEEASDCTWTAGWDACSSEALRYLVEVEGLPVHHPTVLAMTSHLQSQRDRLLFKT